MERLIPILRAWFAAGGCRWAGLFCALALLAACGGPPQVDASVGNVIFIHPDGSGMAAWTALRLQDKGPDGELEWDRLPHLGVYRGHLRDSLVSSSNGGATVHAYGLKATYDQYGFVPAADGPAGRRSIMRDAIDAGLAAGVVNSGHLAEPGTGVFLASVRARAMTDEITRQLIHSGADVILGGGEVLLLPQGKIGFHGEPGRRGDGVDLVAEAGELGYTVVYTRQELAALPADTPRVFGVFAAYHTFNDRSEEDLAAAGLPPYTPEAPTVAEMTVAALRLLEDKGRRFLLVVEEEGTDNFGNANNAAGMLAALHRADAAIGVARRFVERRPDTLLITAADSDAGGMHVVRIPPGAAADEPLAAVTSNGAPLDGRAGTASPPFVAAPDRFGRRLLFGVAWATYSDVEGSVLARAAGLNAGQLPVNADNTCLYVLMYRTLFGAPAPR
jgi:alkaline phosphatase